MAGLDLITRHLFGIRLDDVPMHKHERWHPSVRKIRLTQMKEATHADRAGHGEDGEMYPEGVQGEGVAEGETVLGYVYMDPYVRKAKFPGSANFAVQFSYALEPTLQDNFPVTIPPDSVFRGKGGVLYTLPRVALVCNFEEPDYKNSMPSLLSHTEVETLFHEFGHTLSNVLSRTQYQHTAGTRYQAPHSPLPLPYSQLSLAPY